MNPMRRAVVRAAASASRVPSSRTSMLGVASKFAAPLLIRVSVPVTARCFSQTFRVASEDSIASSSGSDGSSRGLSEEPGFGLFVRNMVFEANEDHLREAYEKYGEITKVIIARDARGLSRGYGFVWFTSKDAMEQAMEETNQSFWHGRRIQVSPRTGRSTAKSGNAASGPTKSLYIGNIPYETTDAELNRIFRELDNVTDVRVAVDRTTGWPRGFAHADFADVEACTAAMEKLKGMTIGGRELRLDYAAESQRTKESSGPKSQE